MEVVKDFERWVKEDFRAIYEEFRSANYFRNTADAGEFSKMSRVDKCKQLFIHLSEIEAFPKYRIRMPCMFCGSGVGNARNHVIGDANFLNKHLSKNGHLYVLKRANKRNFDGEDVNDSMFWSHEKFKWERSGHRSDNVTFQGFCQDCDNSLFTDIDEGIKNSMDYFKQIYRSACSLYYRFLEQAIKGCYIADVLEDFGLSRDGWSDLMILSEYGDLDRKPVNSRFVQRQSLYGAFVKYRITRELQAGLDYENDVVDSVFWRVESPSIYCGVVFEHVRKGANFERVRCLYRKVDHICEVVVVLPLKENETIVLSVTLPLGIRGYRSMVGYLAASERPDIVFTQDLVRVGLPTLCDLYMSPSFFDSMPSQHLSLFTDVNKHSHLPEVSLFDGFCVKS